MKISEALRILEEIPDEDWTFYIIGFIQKFYGYCNKSSLRVLSEKDITRKIRFFLLRDDEFSGMGFKINAEPEANSEQVGYYDLKFEHSGWQKKYLAFECKLMDASSQRLKNYIYTPPTESKKENGGLYRFLVNKYANDLNIGGMLAYVIKDDIKDIINRTKKELMAFQKEEKSVVFGNVIDANMMNSLCFETPNSFISEHIKYDLARGQLCKMPVRIYHLFLNFA